MTLTKKRGIYHVSVKGKGGRTRWIPTGESDRSRALKIVADAGVSDLERAAAAGRLTREAIGHITTGRRLTLEKCLAPFKEWLTACARSPKTINNNVVTVAAWLRDMKIGNLHPASATVEHVAKWVNDPKSKLKRSSRAIQLSCIRSLFSFMAANGWIVTDVSRLVEVDYSILSHDQKESGKRHPFTEEEFGKLVEYLDNNGDEDREKFWYFAVLCSRENGLRLGDICQLEWACFTQEPHSIVVWTDKRNKRIAHLMSPILEYAFNQIMPIDARYLFPEQRAINQDVKKRSILSVQFKRICDKLDINDKSFHCLRHLFACNQSKKNDKLSLAKKLAENLSISEIQSLMGHSSPKTTRGYLHEEKV